MSHPNFLTDNSHVLLSGVTGSGETAGGKTATANWWQTQLVEQGHVEWSITYDPKGGQFTGQTVRGPTEAADAVQAGANQLNWWPRHESDLADQHDDAIRFAEGLRGSVVVVHDDAVTYADADSLQWATALAGNPGKGQDPIKSIVVSQDPWDLPRKGVRANINNLGWVGEPTPEMERYYDVMRRGHVAEEIAERHTAPYMWSVHDGSELHTYEPVPERFVL